METFLAFKIAESVECVASNGGRCTEGSVECEAVSSTSIISKYYSYNYICMCVDPLAISGW